MAKKAPNPIDKHVGSRVRMRRMMLSMSQEKLGDALGPHLPAGAEIREGHQPHRRQPPAADLQYPASAGLVLLRGRAESCRASAGMGEAPSPAYVSDFLATSDGLSLTKSFMRIKSGKLRRRIVDLVEQIAGGGHSFRRLSPTPPPRLPTAARILTSFTAAARTSRDNDAAVTPRPRRSFSSGAHELSCSPAKSVSEGHPDKVCDQISDAMLDAFLENDVKLGIADDSQVNTRLGCETLCDHQQDRHRRRRPRPGAALP